MITARYCYWVMYETPVGPDSVEIRRDVDFQTDDHEHALELADRFKDEYLAHDAEAMIPGTLHIVTLGE